MGELLLSFDDDCISSCINLDEIYKNVTASGRKGGTLTLPVLRSNRHTFFFGFKEIKTIKELGIQSVRKHGTWLWRVGRISTRQVDPVN